MKAIYLSLFVLLMANCCRAQRIVDLELVSTEFSLDIKTLHILTSSDVLYYDGTTQHYFVFTVKNNGPDSLIPGDTIHIKSTGCNGRLSFSSPTFLKKDSSISTFPVTVIGNTMHPWITLPAPPWPQTAPQIWEDSIWVTNGPSNTTVTDPYLLNNENSTPVIAFMKFPASIKEAQDRPRLNVYPNPAVNSLNIEFDFVDRADSACIALVDMTGRIVEQKLLQNVSGLQHHTVDVSGLLPGMYMAELRYNEKCMVSKVSIK